MCTGLIALSGAWAGMNAPVHSAEIPGAVITILPQDETATADGSIRFNFKDASFEQVIDFFARVTGLPVVWETSPPEGTLSYLSPEAYSQRDALRVLNIILQSRGVMLRQTDEMLYLQKLTEMAKEDIPTYVGELPAAVTGDQVVTVVRPLNTAAVGPLAETLAAMVADYGSVTAMTQQNALVIVETAANVRRLMRMVDELDREDPEGALEIIPIEHTKAAKIMEPLQALLAIKVEKYVINKDGKQTKVEEESMPGLNITHDDRTNSIVAKGLQSRIDKLKEVVDLLDVPGSGEAMGRSMRTFGVAMVSAGEAAKKLNELFKGIAEEQRPTVVALDETQRVTVVGSEGDIAEAEALLRQIDGGGDATVDEPATAMAVEIVKLRHAAPEKVIAAVKAVLSRREQVRTTLVPGPDGKSMIVAAPSDTLARLTNLAASLDTPADVQRRARLIDVEHGDIAVLARRARDVYDRQVDTSDPEAQIIIEIDSDNRLLTVVGSETALTRFEQTLRDLEQKIAPQRETVTRIVSLNFADAAKVNDSIRSAMPHMTSADSGERMDVQIVSAPGANALILVGEPGDVGEIEALIGSMDERPSLDAVDARTFRLKHAEAGRIAPLVQNLLNDQQESDPRLMLERIRRSRGQITFTPRVRVEADARSNALIVSGPQRLVALAEQMIAELDADPSEISGAAARSVRVLRIENADAARVAETVSGLFDGEDRAERAPVVRVDGASNTLIVRATEEQFDALQRVVDEIDAATVNVSRQMQVIPIDPTRANAAEVAEVLRDMLERGRSGAVEVVPLEDLVGEGEGTEASRHQGIEGKTSSAIPWHAGVLMSVFGVVPQEDGESGGGLARLLGRLQQKQDVGEGKSSTSTGRRPVPPAQETTETSESHTGQWPVPPDAPDSPELTIAVDELTNTLVVLGSPRGIERVRALADQIEGRLPAAPGRVRYVPLPDGVDGRTVQRLVTDALRGLTPPGGERGGYRDRVRVLHDPAGNAIVVTSADADFGVVGELIATFARPAQPMDATLQMYTLEHADAGQLRRTLRDLFRARFRSMRRQPGAPKLEPEFAVDPRTNTLMVTASAAQLAEVEALLETLDTPTGGDETFDLTMIELKASRASDAARLLQQVVVGNDQRRKAQTQIAANDQSGVLLVRAADDVLEEIRTVLDEIDRDAASAYPVRTIVLERADAQAVAQAVQQFYDDLARISGEGRGRGRQSRRVSVVGHQASSTLLVAASDDDFEDVQDLVDKFDSPEATGALEFRVFPLEHAKASDIEETVEGLISDLTWNQGPIMWGQPQRSQGTLAVRAEPRLNALIVTGEGNKFDVVEDLIDMLDAPTGSDEQRVARLYRSGGVDVNTAADMIRELYTDTNRRWWREADPRELRLRVDWRTRTLFVVATEKEHEEIAALMDELAEATAGEAREVVVLPVEFADAQELSRTLTQFVRAQAQATNEGVPGATVLANRSSNALVVTAGKSDLATIRDLLAKLDQANVGGDRRIEIVPLDDGDAAEIARIVSRQFSRTGRGRDGDSRGVIITPDARTNALIVNAPKQQFAEALALIEQLDTPDAAEETVIKTYALDGAQADEAVRILSQTLQLDSRGRAGGDGDGISIKLDEDAEAVQVRGRIVADPRSNSLIVTASPESLPVIESLIARLDEVPASNPIEYRIVKLDHALAVDVSYTINQLSRTIPGDRRPRFDYNRVENELIIAATADQFEQIDKIIDEIDQPSETQRITDFVPLQFAEAAQIQEALSVFYGPYAVEADTPGKLNVRIVADQATNSLVITAAEAEWQGIRELLGELDNEEYDSSLQLRVLPLRYADAESVAQAINEAFQGTIERNNRGGQDRQRRDDRNGDRRDREAPALLVEAEEWVRASAEPITNSVVVSANRQNVRKIENIVEQLDVPDFAKMAPPRIIPVTGGNPVQLAESLRELYQQGSRRGGGRDASRKSVRIVADESSNAIIVRAEDDQFEQIQALAAALQEQTGATGVTVRTLTLESAPAFRVAEAIRDAFTTKAQKDRLPLTIDVDPVANTLIVASSGGLFEEIRETVEALDQMAPAADRGIYIIELDHTSPQRARDVIEQIGLNREQNPTAPARLVSEPITTALLPGRNAIVVIANPADREFVVDLLREVDASPEMAEAMVRVIPLRNAQAEAVRAILAQMLSKDDQAADSSLADALQEQIRRLTVRRDGANEPDVTFDLTEPVRIIAASNMNAVILASTPDNVAALEEVVTMLDTLPITDAVAVQLFPLENIAATEFARIVRELFEQGKQLSAVPGADLRAVPSSASGRAMLDEIAITVDERTNTVIVAGRDESVAMVDVLKQRLDSEIQAAWVEPRVVPLKHADAIDLAETLNAVVVEGGRNLPQASPLQRQIARLRMARVEENGGRVLEADVFTPMTRLVIRPESQLNAIVLVGTPANLEVVTELIGMLDIEAASPSAVVRVYPIENASAARLAQTITQLFDQQVQSKAIRPEDRVIAQPEERTNTLIVTTSPRSFAVVEELLQTLDSEIAPDLREIRQIAVENASAARLADLVQELMDARLERLRRVQPETAELERATIVADPRTNSLIVAAGNESFEVVRRLVADLDNSELVDTSLIQVINVESGNVERIAEAVNQIMERRYADLPADVRQSQRPLVMTDPRSNSLMVAAGPDDVAAIVDLVAKLDAAPINPAVDMHIVAVPYTTSAQQLAQRLQRLMREREQTLGDSRTPSDRVTIEPDPATNSLIVAASTENFAIVENLIEMLNETADGAADARDVEVVSLKSSRASDVVSLLDDLYVDQANENRGDNLISVTADERLNAVLVNAPEADTRKIKDLIAQLDGTKPASVVEIKFVPLTSADALETVSLIENILSGRGIGARRGSRQATVLRYLREIAGDDAQIDPDASDIEVSAAIRESITLTPDVRTNTIIVSAPRESIDMIERMIRDLDDTSVGSKNIRIFKLTNADAEAMAQILTDLFNLRQGNTLNVLKPREFPGEGPDIDVSGGGFGLGGVELTTVPDARQQLSITVDSRTNSLLVSGTPRYLDLVEQVVVDLDALEANEREVFVYQLRNAVAEDVARVIGDFVQEEQQKLVQTLSDDQLGSAARLLEREITITGDALSNTVLVSASPRYMDTVKEMIREIDVDPPQVLIQVMLAEVTLDSSDDWGVDMMADGRVGSLDIAGGFGLASAFVTGMGVPNLSIASNDFDLLIRAMQSQGRLQVLSNPSVMAANNAPARLQVGETIRVPEGTFLSDSGQSSTTLSEEEIGVILEVIPSINPDGFVRMEIQPEISSLSARTTQVSENFESPIITKREASTVVTVHDGQTIVIGGLISDRFETRDNKVPFLGDLPLLGALFRSETTETAKTEFLIVLTPYVIASPADFEAVDSITTDAIDRLSVPDEVKDQIRQSITNGTGALYDMDGNAVIPPLDDPAGPPLIRPLDRVEVEVPDEDMTSYEEFIRARGDE